MVGFFLFLLLVVYWRCIDLFLSQKVLDNFRKRLTRAGYYNIHITKLRNSVFLTCFDLYGDFHHLEIPHSELPLIPRSTIYLFEEHKNEL